MHPRRQFIRRVELTHVALGAVAFGLAFALAPQAIWVGVGTGALLGAANFRAMANLLDRFTTGDTQARSLAVGMLMGKLLVMAFAVFAVLTWLAPDPAAFAGGLTVAPVSLLLVSAFARPTTPDSADGGQHLSPAAMNTQEVSG